MPTKVNGAAYRGVWVEKKTAFIKITFSANVSALAAANLRVLGTTTAVGAGTVASSTFNVVESALVQALKNIEGRATILAISDYNTGTNSVDVMVGNAEGWFSDTAGLIAATQPITGAQAVVTTPGAAPTDVAGMLVSVAAGAVTYNLEFCYMNGSMPVATGANGNLVTGPGATSGASPVNSATGTAGFYPV